MYFIVNYNNNKNIEERIPNIKDKGFRRQTKEKWYYHSGVFNINSNFQMFEGITNLVTYYQ